MNIADEQIVKNAIDMVFYDYPNIDFFTLLDELKDGELGGFVACERYEDFNSSKLLALVEDFMLVQNTCLKINEKQRSSFE